MSSKSSSTEPQHPVVSSQEWLAARKALLAKEKEFNRIRDELSQARRDLPWEPVGKDYVFEGPDGKQSLSDLFGDSSQLIVYHFMYAPDWDAACKSCSFWADNFNGIDVHLKHRDIAFVAIGRAPYAKLAAYKKRMGWSFKWVSSADTDFNYDYQASFRPEDVAKGEIQYNYGPRKMAMTDLVGVSVFAKDSAGKVFHTYSTYARGVDMLNGAYHYIDLTPKGRDEGGKTQFWVRRHDEYAD
jgi:predicted dithiol-disulfide oxidoreductase (DUF899 family)